MMSRLPPLGYGSWYTMGLCFGLAARLRSGDVSWSAPSRRPRSFGIPVGKVRLRHLRQKTRRLRVLGIGMSKGLKKIDTASGNSRKMQTNRLADKETLVGTSDDHGIIAGALLLTVVHGMLLTGQVYLRVWVKTAPVTKGSHGYGN